MCLRITSELYNGLLRYRQGRHHDAFCVQGHTIRKRLGIESFQILFLCCCTLSQEYTWSGLGLKGALKAAGSGDRTEGQGWASRAVGQRKLAARPNNDARAILGGMWEEGAGGGESVTGTPNSPSTPSSVPGLLSMTDLCALSQLWHTS